MQFAAIRTDLNLQQVGEPINFYIALEDGVYPSPGATLVTKIIPQRVGDLSGKAKVRSEYEAAKFLHDEVFTAGTVAVGYNSVAFDDRFISHLFYRNFYDAYDWQYASGRGKWDIFKITPFISALRPEGIKWPTRDDGTPSFKLEDIARENNIEQKNAHDAISDVEALIGLTKLFKTAQPKMYEYLFNNRDKKSTEEIIRSANGRNIFVSSNGIANNPQRVSVFADITKLLDAYTGSNERIICNLAVDPDDYAHLSDEELLRLFSWQIEESDGTTLRPPLGTFLLNRCTPTAPLSVVDETVAARIGVTKEQAEKNYQKLLTLFMNNSGHNPLRSRLTSAYFNAKSLRPAKVGTNDTPPSPEITTFREQSMDGKLYSGGFLAPKDKQNCQDVHSGDSNTIAGLIFSDKRYNELLLEFRLKYYAESLSKNEETKAKDLLARRKAHGIAKFNAELTKIEGDAEFLGKLLDSDIELLHQLKAFVSALS